MPCFCDIAAPGHSAVAGICCQPVPRARAEAGAHRARPEPVCVAQQHHGRPGLPLASAACAAGDLGPSPGHFQPSCRGRGYLGSACRGPGAVGRVPSDDPLGARRAAFFELRSPGPASDGRLAQLVAAKKALQLLARGKAPEPLGLCRDGLPATRLLQGTAPAAEGQPCPDAAVRAPSAEAQKEETKEMGHLEQEETLLLPWMLPLQPSSPFVDLCWGCMTSAQPGHCNIPHHRC